MNYNTKTKILKALEMRSRTEGVKELNNNERTILLEEEDKVICRNFPLKTGHDGIPIDKLKDKLAQAIEKAENFSQTHNLTNVTYNFDYDCIGVAGHKSISDQDLIKNYEKRVLDRLKQEEKIKERKQFAQEKSKQAQVKNKTEAKQEIERLKKKFSL